MVDLQAQAWFGIVESLALDQCLEASYMYRCIHGIFPAERKIVAIHS